MALSLSAKASARAEVYSDEPAAACYQSALLAVSTGDVSLVERKLRASIGYAPMWYRPHLLLAELLEQIGRSDEAAREGRIAVSLAGTLEQQVRDALKDPGRGPV
jgi:Tfp pilus assembly protein PilF